MQILRRGESWSIGSFVRLKLIPRFPVETYCMYVWTLDTGYWTAVIDFSRDYVYHFAYTSLQYSMYVLQYVLCTMYYVAWYSRLSNSFNWSIHSFNDLYHSRNSLSEDASAPQDKQTWLHKIYRGNIMDGPIAYTVRSAYAVLTAHRVWGIYLFWDLLCRGEIYEGGFEQPIVPIFVLDSIGSEKRRMCTVLWSKMRRRRNFLFCATGGKGFAVMFGYTFIAGGPVFRCEPVGNIPQWVRM